MTTTDSQAVPRTLTDEDIDWLRGRFRKSGEDERGSVKDGTLEGTIARLVATLDARAEAASLVPAPLGVAEWFGALTRIVGLASDPGVDRHVILDVAVAALRAVASPATPPSEALRELALAAKKVMDALDHYGPSIVPHLIDTDENAGQRLRDLVRAALASGDTEPGGTA